MAIGATGWQASQGATAALRQATYERLTAIRETRSRQLVQYFDDVAKHVLALCTDESTIEAALEFRQAWAELPPAHPQSPRHTALERYYPAFIAEGLVGRPPAADVVKEWFPADPRTITLQSIYLVENPHPVGAKDMLLSAPQAGRYGRVHEIYHPTLHRYQSAFGFHDILLIGMPEQRVLYTVLKEIDLGASLSAPPYRETSLARAVARALALEGDDRTAVEDYAPYGASHFAPAAFVAAPVRRAGVIIAVLAVQVSIAEVNRVMTGNRRWREEGLGETGQAYVVGPDNKLRSDVRVEIEQPERFYADMEARLGPEVAQQILSNRTAILNLSADSEAMARIRAGLRETEIAADFRGVEVLRAAAPLAAPGLDWILVAEIETGEALSPVRELRARILMVGVVIGILFLLAAGYLARSVTRPVLALAENARRLGGRAFGVRIPVESADEIGQLADSFNRMAEDLEKTTVSKEDLEALAGKLITAQEDERSRLARELHDDLTQRIAAVAIEAGRLAHAPAAEPQATRAALERIKEQLAALSDDVHRLSRSLHPATLDDLGLAAAVEAECRSFFERGGPPVDLALEGDYQSAPRDVQLAVYRIVQEALRNIQRHADAGEVSVRLWREPASIELDIRDNGRGFDRLTPSWRPGLGLASMEERARLAGGRFAANSRVGQGTHILVSMPLKGMSDADS